MHHAPCTAALHNASHFCTLDCITRFELPVGIAADGLLSFFSASAPQVQACFDPLPGAHKEKVRISLPVQSVQHLSCKSSCARVVSPPAASSLAASSGRSTVSMVFCSRLYRLTIKSRLPICCRNLSACWKMAAALGGTCSGCTTDDVTGHCITRDDQPLQGSITTGSLQLSAPGPDLKNKLLMLSC